MAKKVWYESGGGVIREAGKGVIKCDDCPCDDFTPESVDCSHSSTGKAWKYYEVLFNNLQDHNCTTCEDFDDYKFVVRTTPPGCYPAPPAGPDDSQCQWRVTGIESPIGDPGDCVFPSPEQSDVGWPWPCHVSTGYGRVDFQVFDDTGLIIFRVRFFGAQQSGGGGLLDVRDLNGFVLGKRNLQFDEYTLNYTTFTNTNNTCRRKFTNPQTEVILRKTAITEPGIYAR